MALRCKGTNNDMLNFHERQYADLLPTLFKLTRVSLMWVSLAATILT
jgi:hypothetical protein